MLSFVIDLFERFVPLCPVREKNLNCVTPWFSDNIKRAIVEKDLAFRVWTRDQSNENREHFKRLRNQVNRLTRSAKARYFGSRLHTGIGSKKLWFNLRDMGLATKRSNLTVPSFNASDYAITLLRIFDDLVRIFRLLVFQAMKLLLFFPK